MAKIHLHSINEFDNSYSFKSGKKSKDRSNKAKNSKPKQSFNKEY